MGLNQDDVTAALTFDYEKIAAFKVSWLRLMELSVWGDVSINKIGAMPRLRKRLLEIGENIQSLIAARAWIPHPREQLKSALGASIKLRDSITAVDTLITQVDGGRQRNEFLPLWQELKTSLTTFVAEHENRWANLLDSQLADTDE